MMPSRRVAVVLGLLAALVFGVAPVHRLRAARESRPDVADGPAKGRQSFDAKPLNASADAARAFAYTPRGGTVLPSGAPQLRSMGSTRIAAASDTTPTAPVDPLDTAPANAIIRSSWTPAASLADARMKHTATVLGDGRVLVAGGFAYTPFGPLASVEIYDPVGAAWSTTTSLAVPRTEHTATFLLDGRVLVAGGVNDSGFVASAEIYDPVTALWTVAGAMVSPRQGATATLLADGRVLIAGGYDGSSFSASAELYDPQTNTWAATGSMTTPRLNHAAALLPDGRVLVTGGQSSGGLGLYLDTAEAYAPVTGQWTAVASMSSPRAFHAMVTLPNGKAAVTGGSVGQSSANDLPLLNSVELFDPTIDQWQVGPPMQITRASHSAAFLTNGLMLVAGGSTGPDVGHQQPALPAEVYDSASNLWTAADALSVGSADQTLSPVAGGGALLVGGFANALATPTARAERFLLSQSATPTITWPTPADIVYVTALGATQLNATAGVSGTFTYSPAEG